MVLNYWYLFLDFIYRHCVFSKPLRFKEWLFPRPQVKPTLLYPLVRSSKRSGFEKNTMTIDKVQN
jgi:lipocalin